MTKRLPTSLYASETNRIFNSSIPFPSLRQLSLSERAYWLTTFTLPSWIFVSKFAKNSSWIFLFPSPQYASSHAVAPSAMSVAAAVIPMCRRMPNFFFVFMSVSSFELLCDPGVCVGSRPIYFDAVPFCDRAGESKLLLIPNCPIGVGQTSQCVPGVGARVQRTHCARYDYLLRYGVRV